MTISVIIAVKTWQKHLEECVNKCLELDYPDFEILILPDSEQGMSPQKLNGILKKGTLPVRIIPTGCVNPGKKRDIAIGYAKGEILAFIDDDAYPEKEWLGNAAKNFKDDFVAAVGGPAVTPPEDNLKQKASGEVFSSALVSANFIYRYLPRAKREVDDYPTCNLLVRKRVLERLGGFKTNFWPGEDTKLCLEITKTLGKKIIYDPEVLIYHHRRQLFVPHLKQVASYALHRGYFVKRYPQTSLKVDYFIPAIFLISLIIGAVLSLFSSFFRALYFSGLSLYLSLIFIFSISKPLRLVPLVLPGIILTHLAYGTYFLKGIFSSSLKEE